LKLHLFQKQVAARFEINIETLKNWERGATEPMVRYKPKIIQFLGYYPESEPANAAQRLIHIRHQLGLTQKALAKAIAVDPVTLYRWEKGLAAPAQSKLDQIKAMLLAKNTITLQ